MTLHIDESKKIPKKPNDDFLRDEKGRIVYCQCGCGRALLKHDPNDRDDTHRGLQYPH